MSEETIQQITKWHENCLVLEAQWDVFSSNTGAVMDSPLGRAVWHMVEAHTEAIAEPTIRLGQAAAFLR